ncbi:hypothetical protein K1T71_008349 [Dendrolimus kikuchii]|uniref:Uncharacterized protein n=1 Tax=Dendrolimus kikuchii TaxID=765133 RepID=A0ACC1CX08_9NEOP|nr:hypothetical protein K1T71_008349 [Dendrolimus kikuchii]
MQLYRLYNEDLKITLHNVHKPCNNVQKRLSSLYFITNKSSETTQWIQQGTSTNLHIKTLQKEEPGIHSSFGPARSSLVFKEIPDTALASSSHSRELLHHDHGYAVAEYDEIQPHAFAHEYPVHIPDHHQSHAYDAYYDHHGSSHHHYSSPHHLDHGYDYKHYKHALAAKTLLWPIAGIALLGAAAALVSNPVLLQLGVVSGKRRRRDTDIVSGPDLNKLLEKSAKKIDSEHAADIDSTKDYKQRMLQWSLFKDFKRDKRTAARSNISIKTVKDVNHYEDDNRYIPIPLQIRHN